MSQVRWFFVHCSSILSFLAKFLRGHVPPLASEHTFDTRDDLWPTPFKYTCCLVPNNFWGLWHSQLMPANSNQFNFSNEGYSVQHQFREHLSISLSWPNIPSLNKWAKHDISHYTLGDCCNLTHKHSSCPLATHTHNSGAKYFSGRL